MTDEEWDETPAGKAMSSFKAFFSRVVMAIGLSLATNQQLAPIVNSIVARAAKDSTLAKAADPAGSEPILTAVGVIATWSGFEGWVQDFVKGVMTSDPDVLKTQPIRQRKYRMDDLLAPAEDKLDIVFQAIQSSLDRKNGVDRFEDLFGIFGLSGSVPNKIKENFYAAQMMRNVWVHNAGVADAQFIRKAKHLGYKKDQLVVITPERMKDYLSAIAYYALIVANRQRAIHGLGPIDDDTGTQGNSILSAEYRGFYST